MVRRPGRGAGPDRLLRRQPAERRRRLPHELALVDATHDATWLDDESAEDVLLGLAQTFRELSAAVDALVADLLDQRQAARAAKDFAAADAIRDQLKAAGIELEDTPQGPQWSL